MRARRLWAGELGGAGKYLFVVPRYETGEENGDILEESEEYQDILQTDLRLEDTHFHSKQVRYNSVLIIGHYKEIFTN